MAFTCIVRCADDTLYVGHTEDLASREQIHNDGKGANYTAARRPVSMVYAEQYRSAASAIARERQLKRWSRDKKEALIRGDRTALGLAEPPVAEGDDRVHLARSTESVVSRIPLLQRSLEHRSALLIDIAATIFPGDSRETAPKAVGVEKDGSNHP
jgi:putative endonuclease